MSCYICIRVPASLSSAGPCGLWHTGADLDSRPSRLTDVRILPDNNVPMLSRRPFRQPDSRRTVCAIKAHFREPHAPRCSISKRARFPRGIYTMNTVPVCRRIISNPIRFNRNGQERLDNTGMLASRVAQRPSFPSQRGEKGGIRIRCASIHHGADAPFQRPPQEQESLQDILHPEEVRRPANDNGAPWDAEVLSEGRQQGLPGVL